jgi:ABC-type glycerol-3-phosphate transport system permease component
MKRNPIDAAARLQKIRVWLVAPKTLENASVFVLLILVTALVGTPFFWMLTTALKTKAEVFALPLTLLPGTPHWENFLRAWNSAPFGQYFLNTLFVTFAVVTLELINACLAGYVFARIDFPGRDFLFLLFLAVMMLPRQVVVVPVYIIFKNLGWINTYMALIIPFAANAFGTFLLRQTFMAVPEELTDAARIDGAGHLSILWNIMIPLSKPAMATFILLSATWRWNDYFWPLIFTNSNNMRTLPVGLIMMRSSEAGTEWNTLMAGTVIVLAPILLLFLFTQRQFIEGIARSGLKG